MKNIEHNSKVLEKQQFDITMAEVKFTDELHGR